MNIDFGKEYEKFFLKCKRLRDATFAIYRGVNFL